VVQLASLKNGDRAVHEAEWRRLQGLYGDLLGELQLSVVEADLGPERGIFHRLRAGPLSEAGARALCKALKERDTGCQIIAP
jgi:hypothetical protein